MAYSTLAAFITLVFFSTFSLTSSIEVNHNGRAITINGVPRILLSGAIHYPRSTAEMWPDLMKKAKAGGLDAIETYVFWNIHEPVRGQYDFSGNHDLIKFIKTVGDAGMHAVLRIGPYVCAEWNYGGFPVWLHNLPGVHELRTANEVYMHAMKNFTTLIADMVKKEKLFASQGGPIILAQIENEYGNVYEPYGAAGKAYLDWCAKFADSLHTGVPWLMCQQKDAPEPMLETCNGWYCHQYKPRNPTTPKMWTENWTGWFKNWGGKDPLRTAEDVAFAVARFFQTGGTFQNYYMYHGGTNFGRTAGGPYITTTYDYDAPLDEYGNVKQPKYGHLKQLHDVLHSIEKTLTTGNITTTELDNSLQVTVYALNGTSTCFFSNANETSDATINYKGVDYDVPAWSVSILPDCKKEAFNTAKVNTQTNVMVKDSNTAEKDPSSLKWSWRPEKIDDTVVLGKGDFSANKIFDQKITNDVSDYLWYMTSVNLDKDDPIWSNDMSIRINHTGHPLHLYVNGDFIGSNWTTYGVPKSVFETKVKFRHGKNQISILSAAIGLQNYGSFFDLAGTGLSGGPVEIVGRKGDETISKDISSHKWSYKVGLHGEANKLFSNQSRFASQWKSDKIPVNSSMTWYKTTFKAPGGKDGVVVDLLGLGKGFAWVNGNNLGRYWPSFLAEDGCSTDPCDYRGSYDNNKCVSNCGKPTQRWYHVPRSFLNDGDKNELILFEEIGGNPANVSFKTVRVGSVCANAYENKVMKISCHGRPISGIKYAHFGETQGLCGSFEKGSCGGAKDALTILKTACKGKKSCSVTATKDVFGKTSCDGKNNKLVVEAVCSKIV
nr:beta-galactosidase 15-like [Ipomoea batatas]